MGIFVFQVNTGEEEKAAGLLERRAGALIKRVFAPTAEVMNRRAGQWVKVVRPLIPGYLFVETDAVEEVLASAAGLPSFMRLLTADGEPLPLTGDEMAWLDAICSNDGTVFPMSTGIIEGGVTKVLSGPLQGREVLIKKIDRHKRVAYIEVGMFGRPVLIRVGLEITQKTA